MQDITRDIINAMQATYRVQDWAFTGENFNFNQVISTAFENKNTSLIAYLLDNYEVDEYDYRREAVELILSFGTIDAVDVILITDPELVDAIYPTIIATSLFGSGMILSGLVPLPLQMTPTLLEHIDNYTEDDEEFYNVINNSILDPMRAIEYINALHDYDEEHGYYFHRASDDRVRMVILAMITQNPDYVTNNRVVTMIHIAADVVVRNRDDFIQWLVEHNIKPSNLS